MGRSFAATLLFAALFGCGPGPRWVNVQAFAPPRSPNASYVAVYEPWSRESVVNAKTGEVAAPIANVHARCVNFPCESTSSGVYIEKKPPNVDHVEIVVEGPPESGLAPVHLSIPFSDTTPLGLGYVVILRPQEKP